MKCGFPGGPRLEWYDRNPQVQRLGYWGQGLVPHALTTRWSYTVPTGKKALVALTHVSLFRITAAGTPGSAVAMASVGPDSILLLSFVGNTVDDGRDQALSGLSLLSAGEIFSGTTYDPSTGGTITYIVEAHVIEFDA